MLTKEAVAEWLDKYIAAWHSYDPTDIGDLFTEDVEYYPTPFTEPYRGRAAVVKAWLENKDEKGTYQAIYGPVAVDGDIAVGTGQSRYFESNGITPTTEFSNLFLLRLDDSGRCREYREWYMEKPRQKRGKQA